MARVSTENNDPRVVRRSGRDVPGADVGHTR